MAFTRFGIQTQLAERFFEWCEKQPISKDITGRAITYALGQKKSLMNVFLDSRLELNLL